MVQRGCGWGGRVLVVILLLAGTAGCGGPYTPGVRPRGEGPGGREQPLGLSPRQELAVGRRAYREVVAELEGRILPADSPSVVRANRVTARLVKAAAIEPLQREIRLRVRGYRFEWETNVVRDRQVNAFCLPAGKLFLYTGILQVMGDDDDFLATVLSHEVAHALAHHASERIARERSGRGILQSLSYSRMQESEADKIGVFLMAFAGYDPRRAVRFWQRMQQVSGGRGGLPELLTDHPSDETRIRALQRWSLDALRAKQAFDEGRIAPPPASGG